MLPSSPSLVSGGQCFILPNIFMASLPLVELRTNFYQKLAEEHGIQWFQSRCLYDKLSMESFLNTGRFDILTALAFPDADLVHLETCMMWMLWAFSVDDFSDSRVQSQAIEEQQDDLKSILSDGGARKTKTSNPYAAMLRDILQRIRATATPGNLSRFKTGLLEQANAQLRQSSNRNLGCFPTVAEFITIRRSAFGGNFSAAMVEYALDLNLPAAVFEHPTTVSMSEALIDIMAWANDLCSLKKEFNDGDHQNLVLVLQHHRGCTLQEAVDELVKMTEHRVTGYLNMKTNIPSFGKNDGQVARYFKAYEEFTQASVAWYYLCPRYFPEFDRPIEKESLTVQLLP